MIEANGLSVNTNSKLTFVLINIYHGHRWDQLFKSCLSDDGQSAYCSYSQAFCETYMVYYSALFVIRN